ncbi:SusC/RagA family TonB-linked outer membrane protein [Aquimarina celericrescens]|uniref:SusC/RagA family TonB-linked outer membrane protein n=1 Tax=Aquimarina celericrescens TaxID=1964542 RepID=A0ABW5AWM2_9FLAO|nr:SusC/RagA family TonB-linked outer membrane protein [Aquimarina celericrescens]
MRNRGKLLRGMPVKKIVSLLLFMILYAAVHAQNNFYTISGTVTDQATGIPVPGVSIYIEGSSSGSVSDFDGKYTFTASTTSGQYQLTASSLGYSTQKITINLGSETEIIQDFQITEDLLSLDEVIVTGSSFGVNKRTLGNAISSVKAEELVNNGAIAIDQALAGKTTGALVQQNSGDPAGGISIRLRGASTIAGSSDPLYIIDGVFVNNSSNDLIDLGGNSQNRLADINPNDIEKIEIVKGAAAAAIYGSRASNGVIQIFTKRGKTGKPRINFSTSIRINELRKEIDYNEVPLSWEDPFDRNNLNTLPAQRYNYQDEIYTTATGTETFLSASGGTDKTTYFMSGSFLDNGGIVRGTNFQRFGFKVNVEQKLADWITANIGLNYIRSESEDMPNGGINSAYGAITGFLFSDNSINPAPNESGVYPVTSLLVPRTNPAEAVNRFDFGQITNRTITNIGFKAQLTDELSSNYTLGIDSYNQSGKAFIPRENTSTQPDGFSRRADVNVFQYNSDLNFSYNTNLSSAITSSTVLGGSWQYEKTESVAISATGLVPIVQVPTAGEILTQGESRTEISYWGTFLQQTFGFKEKLFINGAIRLDGASVFGKDERNQVFGKASISYLISSEDFWKDTFGSAINTFKLRASWGQAGNLTALGFDSRLSVFDPISISGSNGLVPDTKQGNENVAPERQDEIEFGIDASFINNRVGLEFTYYQQEVSDLLLERELSPSTGFGTRFENIGSLENKGFEVLLRFAPFKGKDFSWDITTTFTKNENEVTDVPAEQIPLGGSFGTNFVIEGEPLGVFYRQYYARNPDGSLLLTPDGFPQVERGDAATQTPIRDSNGQPSGSTLSKVIGDPNPEWFGSLINEFSYKNLGLRIQLDAVQGYDVFNWNRRLLDNAIFGGGAQAGRELAGEIPKGTGGVQAGIFEEFVEDGSFVKLREVALSYNFTPKSLGIDNLKISFIGRNLISWDSYSGWDPEINTAGQSNGVRGFDFAGVPIPRTYQISVNASF